MSRSFRIRRARWDPDPALELSAELSTEAVMGGAEHLLDRANAQAPRDTGALIRSGTVSVEGDLATVSYDVPYAGIVHAKFDAWLSDAIGDEGDAVGERFAETFRGGWPQ